MVTLQFSCMVIMLLSIFKSYDDLVKQALWDGREARIKLRKLHALMKKGG